MADRGMSLVQIREVLGHWIDLAVLPDDLADKYETSNRAWHLFLNDIIRDAVPALRLD